MKKVLADLSPQEISHQSKVVAVKLFNLPAFKQASRISLFLSMKDEIDTTDILSTSLGQGKQCFIPLYNKESMKMVKITDMEDYRNLPLTKWNIKQPLEEEVREDALETGGLDLILVPGLAFTAKGDRCGRGKGYYDKFLNDCAQRQAKPPVTVALAFSQQILENVPTDSHDHVVDIVLVE